MNERIGTRERAREAGERKGGERVGPERVVRGRVIGLGLLAGLLGAAALVIAGCGKNAADRAPAESHAQVETATPPQTVAAVPASQESPASGAMMTEGTGAAGGLPPEIAASVTDTLVVPGQPVEIEVEATSDVSQIALSDGRGDPLPFVRDSTGNAWRVGYRVPLRPREDRVGLSVTAHNQTNRWRRVWVFLHVQRPETEQKMEGDSLSGSAK